MSSFALLIPTAHHLIADHISSTPFKQMTRATNIPKNLPTGKSVKENANPRKSTSSTSKKQNAATTAGARNAIQQNANTSNNGENTIANLQGK
jgi:hypothetical protein